MKIENQVPSLELCQRLKELGWNEDTYFVWYRNAGNYTLIHNPDGFKSFPEKTYPAPTVAELGEALPKWNSRLKNIRMYFDEQEDKDKKWGAEIALPENYVEIHAHTHFADTEANARAKMWIYLKENNLI